MKTSWPRVATFFLLGIIAFAPVRAQPIVQQGADPIAMTETLLKRGQFSQAEITLRQAGSAADTPHGRYLLGFTLIQLYRFDEAEAALQRAVASRPEAAWLHALAKSQIEQGKHRAALVSAERAIDLEPAPEYLFAAAMAALNMGELDRAEDLLRRCLAAAPNHAEAQFKLAQLLVDRGRYDEARPPLEVCLKTVPTHLEARYLLGLVARRRGDLEGAVRALEAVTAEVPGHVGGLYNLGGALIELGRAEEGRRRLDQFRAMSQLQDEIEYHVKAVKKNPGSVDGRILVAELQLQAGRSEDALEQLLAARQLQPRRAQIYRELARAFERLGRADEERRAERFAMQLEGGGS